MSSHEHYQALLAEGTALPTLLCGHCRSILSRARIFQSDDSQHRGTECRVIGLCSADDCGAVNCCDAALAHIDNPERIFAIAS